MALSNLPVLGRPTIWMVVGHGPTALAVGAGRGCLDIFTLVYPFILSPSLCETARYRLKYCLKGPLNPKQPTNHLELCVKLYSGQENSIKHLPDKYVTPDLRLHSVYIDFQCCYLVCKPDIDLVLDVHPVERPARAYRNTSRAPRGRCIDPHVQVFLLDEHLGQGRYPIHPNMTLDVHRGCKTTTQQVNNFTKKFLPKAGITLEGALVLKNTLFLKKRTLLAHLSHRLRVSYCHGPMSVVRRASSVFRRPLCVVNNCFKQL